MKHPLLKSFVMLFMVCCFLPGAAFADDAVRLQLQAVDSGGDIGFGGDFGSSFGFYAGFEKRINERFGVEVGLAWTEFEQDIQQDLVFTSIGISSSLRMTPVTVALNIHLTPEAQGDFYLAPKVGYAFFGDLEIDTVIDFNFPIPGFPNIPGGVILSDFEIDVFDLPFGTSVGVKDQFLFGLRLGYDVPLGGGAWILSGSVDYTVVDLEIEGFGGFETSLDPLSIGLGLSFRF